MNLEQLVKEHTRYSVTCECGEFLGKRDGPFSFRDQWEAHFVEVLAVEINILQEEISRLTREVDRQKDLRYYESERYDGLA